MNKKLTPKQLNYLKNQKEEEMKRRFYQRNWDAMRFCNKHGLTIYVAAQSNNSNFVKIFVQKGVPFKPLNNILYDQTKPEDVIKYISAIDAEYERIYLKMKDKI